MAVKTYDVASLEMISQFFDEGDGQVHVRFLLDGGDDSENEYIEIRMPRYLAEQSGKALSESITNI